MQCAIWVEIICFSIAILKRQLLAQSSVILPPADNPSSTNSFTALPITETSKRIAFKTNKGFEIIFISEIILIQGGGNSANFVKLFREGQTTPVIVLQTLANIHKALSDGTPIFDRLHKSYIVNMDKIQGIHKDADGLTIVVMSNKKEVPVSNTKLPILKGVFNLVDAQVCA